MCCSESKRCWNCLLRPCGDGEAWTLRESSEASPATWSVAPGLSRLSFCRAGQLCFGRGCMTRVSVGRIAAAVRRLGDPGQTPTYMKQRHNNAERNVDKIAGRQEQT